MRVAHIIDVPPTRFVVAHYHIFKNGGTTIESILRREFDGVFATIHGPQPDSILGADDLAAFLTHYSEICAVSSHHLRYPKPSLPRTVIFDCCFLRHPLDRLASVYTWLRDSSPSDPLARRAHDKNQRQFMVEMMRDFPHVVSDVQVTQLALAGAFTRPANERDLECAARVFCDMSFPGLVEMFGESLVAAEYFLRPAFPELRLDQPPQNVSRPDRLSLLDRPPKLEEMLLDFWGPDVYEDLVRINRLDLELHRRAQGEIRRRLFLIPGLDEKLIDFKARSDERGAANVLESTLSRDAVRTMTAGSMAG